MEGVRVKAASEGTFVPLGSRITSTSTGHAEAGPRPGS